MKNPAFPVSEEVLCIADNVAEELWRAMQKFPTWPDDPLHAAAVVFKEAGELQKSVLEHIYEPNKSSIEDVRVEALQTAAMAFRFLLSIEKYEFTGSPQHTQE